MGKPYSMDLRERVVTAIAAGDSRHTAAKRFKVSVSTAIRWAARPETTGSVAPGQLGGHKPRVLSGGHREWLLERMKTDFTLRGLVAELAAERGIKVDYRSVW